MALQPNRVHTLRALHDTVLVEEMNFQGRQLSSGIILPGDNGKSAGIRPRWDVQVGQWICVAHGRWTRGIDIEDPEGQRTIRKIDPKDILLVSDEHPGSDDTISDAVSG